MTKATLVMLFVSAGLFVGCLSLGCATQIAIRIGGRLGEAIRNGSPETMAVGAFWMVGMLVSSILNCLFGWSAGTAPDHAFYAMAFLVMFTIPFLAACLAMALLAANY